MGENCRIMNEIADALREEEEHRRWATENGYHDDEVLNCQYCAKVAELQRQVTYWKNKYLSAPFDYKEKILHRPF